MLKIKKILFVLYLIYKLIFIFIFLLYLNKVYYLYII